MGPMFLLLRHLLRQFWRQHQWRMMILKISMVHNVRATLPSALNVMNASSVGKLVQLVTASRLTLYHEGQIDPMKDECHYQVKH